MSKIVRTEVTESWINITLENGVTISLSSNENSFHLSLGRVELPLKWGYYSGVVFESNNTLNCFYEPTSH